MKIGSAWIVVLPVRTKRIGGRLGSCCVGLEFDQPVVIRPFAAGGDNERIRVATAPSVARANLQPIVPRNQGVNRDDQSVSIATADDSRAPARNRDARDVRK